MNRSNPRRNQRSCETATNPPAHTTPVPTNRKSYHQSQKASLPVPIRPDDGHPLAKSDLAVERLQDVGDSQLLSLQYDRSRPRTTQPHSHALLDSALGRLVL